MPDANLLGPPNGRLPVYVVAENVRSLFNVGALFRTADGICAAGIYLTGFTGRPPRKEIHRVALGAEASVPWAYARDPLSAVSALRDLGAQIVALEQTAGSEDYRTFPYRFPTAVVVGHEVRGVSPELLSACDGAIEIPMMGEKTSLNVSVASGIVLYELLRVAQGGRPPGAHGVGETGAEDSNTEC